MKQYEKPEIPVGAFLLLLSGNPHVTLVNCVTKDMITTGIKEEILQRGEKDPALLDRIVQSVWRGEWNIFIGLQ